jgi:hypothetical protein
MCTQICCFCPISCTNCDINRVILRFGADNFRAGKPDFAAKAAPTQAIHAHALKIVPCKNAQFRAGIRENSALSRTSLETFSPMN